MLSQTAINQVDSAFVARLPREISTPGQSVLGISLIYFWAIGGFLSALAVGTQALTARRAGERAPERAGQVLTNSLLLTATLGALASVISFFVVPHLGGLMFHDPVVRDLGVPYLRIRMLGVFTMVTTVSFKAFFDGLGKTRVHMYAALAMNVTNLILCFALILGHWGFPRMGVTGAALSATLSSVVGLALMAVWSLRGEYRRAYRYYRPSNVSARLCRELGKLALPSGVATLAVMSGFALFVAIVLHMDKVAGHAAGRTIFMTATKIIVLDVLSFAFMTCIAYGTATATLVGQSMGAKRPDLAEAYTWTAVKLGVVIVAFLGGCVALWPQAVLAIFTQDAEVVALATTPLRVAALAMPVVAAAMVFMQALFGAGDTRFVMYAELLLHFTCMVPLAYLFGMVLGWAVFGVTLAVVTYAIVLALVMGWKFSTGHWKYIDI